jgi:hypothetical protein
MATKPIVDMLNEIGEGAIGVRSQCEAKCQPQPG